MSDDLTILLKEIADRGGEITVYDGEYARIVDEAEYLRLVSVELEGGGFGFSRIVRLTNAGKRKLGLPVSTPALAISIASKLRSILNGRPTKVRE